jgi:hypothetical protein
MANERESPPGRSGLSEQIKQDGRQRIEEGKRTAAEHIETVAQALESARERLDQDQPTLAAYAGRMSTGVGNLATRLREGSLEDLLQDTRDLARRNPVLFLAGGVAIGFALSRFLKASASTDYTGAADYTGAQGPRVYAGGQDFAAGVDASGNESYASGEEDLGGSTATPGGSPRGAGG